MSLSITLIIVIITAIISFMAFSNQEMLNKLIFYPPAISKEREWYRFFSNGLIHADLGHLAFNMISLYMFGDFVETAFAQVFGDSGKVLYLVMYITALAVCLVPTYISQKDNYYYRSLGASGAVSAVVFVGIFLYPDQKIGLFFIPPIIPGFIFGPIYLIATAYLAKRGSGNINHSAHLWGALYGIAFLIVLSAALHTGFSPIDHFIESVKAYFQG